MGEVQSLQHQLSDCIYTANVTIGIWTKALVLERKLKNILSIDLLDIIKKKDNSKFVGLIGETLIANPLIIINK